MPVELPATPESGLEQRRLRFPKWGLLAGAIATLLAVGSALRVPQRQLDWLTVGQPCAIEISNDQSQVDIFLSPDVPVTLLISNLGSSSQSALMTIKSESLRSPPQFRPVPLRVLPNETEEGDSSRISSLHQAPGEQPPNTQILSAPPATRNFWLHVTSHPLEDPAGYQLVHGRLGATGDRVQVYFDSSLLSSNQIPTDLADTAKDIVTRLEREVLPAIRQQIGPVTDVDHDGRLTVLITPWLGRLRGGETHVRGFVRSSDFRSGVAAPFSNQSDILYLNSDLPMQSGLQTLLGHELAHAALFSVPQMRQGGKEFEWDDWLNEGIAHLTERSVGGDWSNVDYRVARYWQDPATAPLLVADYYRCGRWRDHGCRGATFLFLDWCQRQHARNGQTDFIPTIVASNKPDIAAVTRVLGTDFPVLYREWAISLVSNENHTRPPRIGRFGFSGPRASPYWADARAVASWNICGTATQFVDLRASQAGWYRLKFAADFRQPWQLTLVKGPAAPQVMLEAQWPAMGTSDSNGLVLTGLQDLVPGWSVECVYCEQIEEPRTRVWRWSVDEIRQLTSESGTVTLPLNTDELQATVIKVQLKHTDGRVTWAWCDVPARSLAVSRTASQPGETDAPAKR